LQEASFVYLPLENRFRELRGDERYARLVERIRGAKARGR
jgi:hypothetical protein